MPHKILLEQLRKGISAIVLLCLTVLAEARQPLFVLDRAAGLSDSRIACMLLSADGRIWIGTGTGINMFNGNNCSSVYAGNGLPSNNILSLCQVADGTVWAGTDAGIGLLDADGRPAGKAIVLPPQIGLAAMDILCTDNQNVWVRGASGVARYSHAGKLLQVLADGSGLLSAKVTCMAIDDNANLWIGTADAGIEFYSTRQNKFLHYGTQLAGAHGEISAHVSGLRFDKNGTLWVSNARGGLVQVQLIESSVKKFSPYNNTPAGAASLGYDGNGYLWSYFARSGLYYKEPSADSLSQFISDQDLGSPVTCLIQSRGGNILAGTARNGIAVYSHPAAGMFAALRPAQSGWKLLCDGAANYVWLTRGQSAVRMSVTAEDGEVAAAMRPAMVLMPSQPVSAFSDADSQLWVLGEDSVLRIFRPEGQLVSAQSMPSAEPLTVCADDAGIIIFSQNKRLYKCNGQNLMQIKELAYVPRHIVFLGSNYLLITDTNTYLWDGKQGSFSEAGFLSALSPIFSVVRAASGELFFGTPKGIYMLDAHSNAELSEPAMISSGHPSFSLAVQGSLLIAVQDSAFTAMRFNGSAPRRWLYGVQIPPVTEAGQVLIGKKSGAVLLQTASGILAKSAEALAKPARTADWQLTVRSAGDGSILSVSKDGRVELPYPAQAVIIEAGDLSLGRYGQAVVLVLPSGDSIISQSGRFTVPVSLIGSGTNQVSIYAQGSPAQMELFSIYIPARFTFLWIAISVLFISIVGIAIYYRKYVLRFIRQLAQGAAHDSKLRELYQAKLNFFTEISHEIRTPLTMIIDPIDQILKQESLSSFTKDKLRIVLENGDKILTLVDSLLDYRKLETGSDTLLAEETDMAEAVEFTVGRFRELAVQRSQEIILHVPQEPLLGWIDRNKFDKILSNIMENVLMNNAEGCSIGVWLFDEAPRRRFRGEGRIAVQVGELASSSSCDEYGAHIEQFFTDTSASNPHSAPGLGLVLAKKLAELHKGELAAERQQNGYYSFRLSLVKGNGHLAQHEIVQQRLPLQSELYDRGENFPADKKTILLVEDNNSVLAYLDSIFLKKYEVLKAANGREGLELAQAYIPDIIISDVMMPEMDGNEMCKRLKNSHTTAHIPIILLTAKTFTEDQVEGLEAGADDYIHKPFKSEILELKVKNILESAERMRKQLKNDLISMPTEAFIESEEDKLMKKLIEYIDRNISDTEISVETLASEMGISRAQLFRKTRAVLGQTPNDLLKSMRLKKAEQLLRQGNLRISDIAFEVGFPNPQYFSQSFVKMYGATPSAYLKKLGVGSQQQDEE